MNGIETEIGIVTATGIDEVTLMDVGEGGIIGEGVKGGETVVRGARQGGRMTEIDEVALIEGIAENMTETTDEITNGMKDETAQENGMMEDQTEIKTGNRLRLANSGEVMRPPNGLVNVPTRVHLLVPDQVNPPRQRHPHQHPPP